MAEYVLIRDPELDADRKFAVCSQTRSIAEGLDAIQKRQLELLADVFDDVGEDDDLEAVDAKEARRAAIELAVKSADIRDEIVELQCERLDLLTRPAKTKDDGELSAGDLARRLWKDDSIAQDWLDGWVEEARVKSVKRPR